MGKKQKNYKVIPFKIEGMKSDEIFLITPGIGVGKDVDCLFYIGIVWLMWGITIAFYVKEFSGFTNGSAK